MIDPIVHSDRPVTLVGAGQATAQDLQISLTMAQTCVAADGGAAQALAAGVTPAAVIGDLDSLDADTRDRIPAEHVHLVAEQDSTDFEKALLRIAAPLVIGVGFLGGRIDHQLAVFHTLTRFPQRVCVLLGTQEVICLAPPQLRLPTEAEETVSLFPLGPVAGQSDGLQWPIAGLSFDPLSKIGTSNRATGPVELSFDRASMLLVLPRRLTQPLIRQLLLPDAARWPARA